MLEHIVSALLGFGCKIPAPSEKPRIRSSPLTRSLAQVNNSMHEAEHSTCRNRKDAKTGEAEVELLPEKQLEPKKSLQALVIFCSWPCMRGTADNDSICILQSTGTCYGLLGLLQAGNIHSKQADAASLSATHGHPN